MAEFWNPTGQHLLHRLSEEAAHQLGHRQRQMPAGELGGFPITATISRLAEQVHVTLAFDGAPSTDVTFTQQDLTYTDPVGLITRLENRLANLEAAKAKALADIDHARSEIDHATASLGNPFPQAADLAAARERSRHIDKQLEAAASPQPDENATGTAGAVEPFRPSPPRPPWPSTQERKAGPTPERGRVPGYAAVGHQGSVPEPLRTSARELNYHCDAVSAERHTEGYEAGQ